MIKTLLLLGATGDLAGRYLFPALATRYAAQRMPADFVVVGSGRHDWDDEAFRRHTTERLSEHAGHVPAAARESLVRAVRYQRVDLGDPRSVATLVSAARQRGAESAASAPLAVYLALPSRVFAKAVSALAAAALPERSRFAIEKPFGDDLAGAMALNQLLSRVLGPAREHAVFRVDHVLGMATAQNLVAIRFANRVWEPVWNSVHIERVEIHWEETLALEGRATYFDRAGMLKDVLQNHALQVLSLVAMEPPASTGEQALRDRKVEVLRSVRVVTPAEAAVRSRRARYTAGRLVSADGTTRDVPAYVDETGVDPSRDTETFAELELELRSPRWIGTPFVLRAGKALAQCRKEIVVRFRPLGGCSPFADAPANELRIGVDGPENLGLTLNGTPGGTGMPRTPLTLLAPPPYSALPAYGRVLLDILSGGSALSVRDDEAEGAWRVMTPFLSAWGNGLVPMEEYPAGSDGPPPRHRRC